MPPMSALLRRAAEKAPGEPDFAAAIIASPALCTAAVGHAWACAGAAAANANVAANTPRPVLKRPPIQEPVTVAI
jgi:hypothetical protein